jgi:tetratricopeptide (TPR) repeat protein
MRYKDAAPLFEKVCELDPTNKRIEYVYSCLGRCYLAMEKHDEALIALEKGYDLYHKRNQPIKDSFERKDFKELLKAYRSILQHFQKNDFASDIDRELNEQRYPGEDPIHS